MSQLLKIACCSHPDSGHMNPIMNLVEGLASQGNDVRVFTMDYGATKFKGKCEKLGAKFVGIDIGETEESSVQKTAGSVPFIFLAQKSKSPLYELLSSFKPDVVVADFTTLAAQEYANELRVPLVVNFPGPFAMVRTMLGMADLDSGMTIGGIFLSRVKFSLPSVAIMANFGSLGELSKRLRLNLSQALVLVNSFWGFEEPGLLPPHILPTGPITPPLPKPEFSKTHPELEDFLIRAQREGKKVLLVTTGSMVQLERWSVEVLCEGFSRLQGCRVVWSLKEEQQQFVDLKDPDFHFSSWLPQPMLLASDLIHGVLTHCGWGGTLECISGAKPVAVLPFFGDQMNNARLLVQAGAATTVSKFPAFNVDSTGRSAYTPKTLTAEGIAVGCQELLTNPSYLQTAKRLQVLSTGPGLGCASACERIEHAGRHGISHLCNVERHLRNTGARPFSINCCAMVACGAVVVGLFRLIGL